MYIPEHFSLPRERALELLRGARAGDLVTVTPDGLTATFVPMLLQVDADGDRLLGHLSRVNPQWQHPGEALFIVNGLNDYVDAEWLSRPDAVSVSTWNYLTVHAHGELVVHDDAQWCLDAVRRMSQAHGDDTLSSMPTDDVERKLRAIVGVELRITRLEAKAKMSQNKSPEVIEQVIAGLAEAGSVEAAEWMRENSLPRAQAKAELLAGIRQQAGSAR